MRALMKSEQLRESEEKWLASVDEDALVARGLSATAFRELARAFLRRADLGNRSWSVNAERVRDAVQELLSFIATRAPDADLVRVRTSFGELAYGEAAGARKAIVVETCMWDRNYIVDTTRMVFDELGYEEMQGVNLILPIRRNTSGALVSIRGDDPGHENESITRFVVRGPDTPEALATLEAELARRMALVGGVATASLRLRKLARELANEYQYIAEQHAEVHDDAVEARAFLEWLLAENYRFYCAAVFERGGHNGDPEKRMPGLHEVEKLGPDLNWEGPSRDIGMLLGRESLSAPFVDVRKSTQSSVFHKKGKLDRVVVRRIDEKGSGAGGVVFIGQFSLQGLATLGAQLPIARRKLRQILDKHEVVASSFQEKAISKAFNTLPIEYLLELDADEIYEVVSGIDEVATSRETLVHLRIQSSRRCASAFVTLADEAFSSDLLDRIENRLRERLRADYSEHRVATGASNTIVLHFFLTGATRRSRPSAKRTSRPRSPISARHGLRGSARSASSVRSTPISSSTTATRTRSPRPTASRPAPRSRGATSPSSRTSSRTTRCASRSSPTPSTTTFFFASITPRAFSSPTSCRSSIVLVCAFSIKTASR
jgi:NAD-specific glutamate dehydrogenase